MITYGGGDGDDDERSSVCKRERVKERERQRDSKYQKHYSLSKYKSTISQRSTTDREKKHDGIHTPCYLSQNIQYTIPYY